MQESGCAARPPVLPSAVLMAWPRVTGAATTAWVSLSPSRSSSSLSAKAVPTKASVRAPAMADARKSGSNQAVCYLDDMHLVSGGALVN